ncbi:DinB family protein [Nocardia crassostreae]|uniref:DinB family protein n=1 Tax=Nocardia crassostreae TaxID=53428 RepID=UPI0008363F4C|nr:DinB family protein [Nocardia crassostreae]
MTWTAPEIDRTPLLYVGDERPMLQSFLDDYRAILLRKCQGLTGIQLATRSVEPSSLSLLGLIRHMTNVERGWFRKRAAGEDVPWLFDSKTNPDSDFDDLIPEDAEVELARYRDEITLCDKAAAALPLDHTFVHPRSGKIISLRWVYLHMIEEYARHCGHADFLRERTDGATGD